MARHAAHSNAQLATAKKCNSIVGSSVDECCAATCGVITCPYGTRIQAEKLEGPDYRGELFKDFNEIDANGVPVSLKGNNDLLIFG